MQNFKEKLYNYEAEPPSEIWQNIASELNDSANKLVSVKDVRKRSRTYFLYINLRLHLLFSFL